MPSALCQFKARQEIPSLWHVNSFLSLGLLLFLCTNLRFAHFTFITSDISWRSLQLLRSLFLSLWAALLVAINTDDVVVIFVYIFCTLFYILFLFLLVYFLCVGSDEHWRQQQCQWQWQWQRQRRRRRRQCLRRHGANVTNVAAAIPSESDGDHFHQRGASERTGSLRKPANGRSGANGE